MYLLVVKEEKGWYIGLFDIGIVRVVTFISPYYIIISHVSVYSYFIILMIVFIIT